MIGVLAVAGLTREMRIGSLEITAALAAVALLAARPRMRAAAEIGSLTTVDVDLEVIERRGRRAVRLRPPFEAGRDAHGDLTLRDPEVSRRHARFSAHEGVVYLDDLQSSNGTFLNGRRVTESIEVRAGDEIDVGTTRIVVTAVRRA